MASNCSQPFCKSCSITSILAELGPSALVIQPDISGYIFYIVESSHAHQHCLHAWPTLIHGNSGHVAVRAGARERCLMNRSLDARSWSACSWLLYCSMQRVMFRPCTHLSDHDTWSNQKVTWSNTCPSRDWPYVMSRQNNQTERDQLMVNSLLYEWCTFPWLYHYLNQWCNIVNWTLGNKLQWNLNRNSNIFIEENTFENVVCEMLFISSRPQCVKGSLSSANLPVLVLCHIIAENWQKMQMYLKCFF